MTNSQYYVHIAYANNPSKEMKYYTDDGLQRDTQQLNHLKMANFIVHVNFPFALAVQKPLHTILGNTLRRPAFIYHGYNVFSLYAKL